MAPSSELCGKGRCGVFAGKTVWSTPERLHLPLQSTTFCLKWEKQQQITDLEKVNSLLNTIPRQSDLSGNW